MFTSTRTKWLSMLAALATAGIVAVLTVGSGASAQTPAATRTITFTEIESKSPCCIADIAPKSHAKREPFMSPGDELVYTQELRDASAKKIGKLYGKCAAIIGAPLTRTRYICDSVYSFADGTILVAGLSRIGEPTTAAAVTGGTGAYANARGTYASKNSETKNDVTITLVG
jgi:hypothetical protein